MADATAVRIFVGVDPGTKGAAGVLACLDCPGDDARHGQVVGFDVFDLPTVDRAGLDGGGLDLDVAAFVSRLTTAVNVAADLRNVVGQAALVEFPDVGGQMKGGRRHLLVQGLNAGMVFAAVRSGLLVPTEWIASRGWRAEVDATDAGRDYAAACAVLGIDPNDSAAARTNPLLVQCSRTHATVRTDRCVAVLLAEVARRRWMGTAAVPRTKGAGRAAKTRKAGRRKEAVARAVAPMTVAKARVAAVERCAPCDAHAIHGVQWRANCKPRMACCEARLLDWAWRQRPEPTEASLDLGAASVELLPRIAAVYMKAVTSKRWSVAWTDSDEVGTMEPEAFAALEKYGLVRLVSGTRDVRYAPTERGVVWAKRLRKTAEGLPR